MVSVTCERCANFVMELWEKYHSSSIFFLYSVGVTPVTALKHLLKCTADSKPHSMLISKILKRSSAKSLHAYPILMSVMYCFSVLPVLSLKYLQNAEGFMAAYDAISSSVILPVYFLFKYAIIFSILLFLNSAGTGL